MECTDFYIMINIIVVLIIIIIIVIIIVHAILFHFSIKRDWMVKSHCVPWVTWIGKFFK